MVKRTINEEKWKKRIKKAYKEEFGLDRDNRRILTYLEETYKDFPSGQGIVDLRGLISKVKLRRKKDGTR